MKNTVIALLVTILLVAVVNLLASLGLLGVAGNTGSGSFEYKVLNAQQMDTIGFRAIAEEEGIEVSEEGEINFPKEMVDKIAKINMLPRTIQEVEKDGGWNLSGITADNHYIFRRAK
ncbi:MAG: hypothetical protein MI807_13020 [Verrucomicrobiales bacterium]|nr:hypothetical protein [Verrucomicrobiales bacterium]